MDSLEGKQKLIFIFITERCSILPLQLIYSVSKVSLLENSGSPYLGNGLLSSIEHNFS